MLGAEPAPLADRKEPKGAASRSDLAVRIASALVLAPLAILAAYLPSRYPLVGSWLFGAFWLIAAIGVWWEWNALVSGPGNRLLFILGATALTLAMIIAEFGAARTRTPILIIALGALAIGVFARADRRTWAVGGLLYAGAVLTAPIVLRRDPEWGFIATLLLFAIVWATDIFGYFAGRALGGRKLWPKISPHKTWAGAIGGTSGATLVAAVAASLAGLQNIFTIALVALVLSIVAQAGDLFESAVKRQFGAKDASHLIPGHGGFMDRIDGFVAAATAAASFGILRGSMDTVAQGLLLW